MKIVFIGIGDILFVSNIYFHEAHFSWNHICSVSSQEVFFPYNNISISIKKDVVQQKSTFLVMQILGFFQS